MALKRKTSDLKKRMRNALQGGGSKAIEKQKAIGKLTARERIIALLDPRSFHEYDIFVEHAARDSGRSNNDKCFIMERHLICINGGGLVIIRFIASVPYGYLFFIDMG